ncbi:hypothetical protein [Alkaliphilus serpentinus]|uniref:Uncharacterized protein n=1 Tax=Alkaliphilus serpentinus TaxID=1482731 RepID=A0A833M8V9_9FIRM|nr:hypothetical protein [Alkaliphilus serpentinus]KAB3531806.1 hypothetical protein F8153_03555 [Alkaliphilus serpentinus]
MSRQIKNLKDFVKVCGSHKTDVEISHMLDIPIKNVTLERQKSSRYDHAKESILTSNNLRSNRT